MYNIKSAVLPATGGAFGGVILSTVIDEKYILIGVSLVIIGVISNSLIKLINNERKTNKK